MPPQPHSRPENVLKRAQELIGVGQAPAALSILHEHVVSKRTRNNPIASLEPVMLLFVELCVDLRKGKLAKDGLYQYKNTAQNTNVGTIELVFKKFIELAEQKVTEAQEKADQVQSTIDEASATSNVEDLEASETPESILLSTVSGEQSKDRTDRAIVTPWLKFLWETYRTVLDIFKNNSRLEIMYQSTAHQAFLFCSKYQRKTEFRRLCELLRNHLQNVAKFTAQMHAINLNEPDTLQRHLDTRFQQLNVAVELELYQEAFRSIEDIHTLLSMSKRPAKPIMMANYFEKLTRIFLVSENYLFHAAAWSRYYNLLRQSAISVAQGQSKKDHPAVTESDMTKAASFVVLSALSIPVISTTRSRGALLDVDEARKSKNARLTSLLAMNQAPTRALLFKDAMSKGLLKRCRPEIRELYNILEVDFHPLSICKRISPILTKIGADTDMAKYVQPLQQVILTRLFQQLSQVYESVKLEFVLDLAQFPEPFKATASSIEKFIMNGCKKGDLAIRIDHTSSVLTFDSDIFSSAKALHPGSGASISEQDASSVQRLQSTPAEIVRSQLTRLAKSLYLTCQYVDPSFNEQRAKSKAIALKQAEAGIEIERKDVLSRREVIDRKKIAASTALAQKEKDLATQKRIKAQELQAQETQRLAEEQRERERRRKEADLKRVKEEENQKALEELKRGIKGIDVSEIDVTDLDTGTIRAIKIRALEKEKTELSEKLRLTARRIDHLERAYRLEEIKHLPEDYERQKQEDYKAWKETSIETLAEAESKHTEDVALKHRLSRLVPKYEEFRKSIYQQRKADFERRRKQAQQEFERKKEQRVRDFRETKARERREREEAELKQREEEERIAQEEEEHLRQEEELRERMLHEKTAREEERRRLDEQAQRQREREQEAEARIAARRAERAQTQDMSSRTFSRDRPGATTRPSHSPGDLPPTSSPPSSGRTPADDTPPPTGRVPLRLQPRGGGTSAGPSWRERQAARQSSGATTTTEAATTTTTTATSSSADANGADAMERSDSRSSGPGAGGGPRPSAAGQGQGMYRGGSGRGRPEGDWSSARGERGERGEREREPERNTSPLPSQSGGGSTEGKYRPGMFAAMRKK